MPNDPRDAFGTKATDLPTTEGLEKRERLLKLQRQPYQNFWHLEVMTHWPV